MARSGDPKVFKAEDLGVKLTIGHSTGPNWTKPGNRPAQKASFCE